MAKDHLRRLLSNISDESDEEGSLPQHTNKEEPKRKYLVSKLLLKPCGFLFLLLIACILSFWAGTRIIHQESNVDGLCAEHTAHWCE